MVSFPYDTMVRMNMARIEAVHKRPLRLLSLPVLTLVFTLPLAPQKGTVSGSAELRQTLDRLNTLGSLLIVGAHPDDERETMIAYFARGRHLRTAYLSATRGEGGQNLIGPEQSEHLGVIRTQELLAARRLDGGEQFFTRAVDFGYSKSPEEALAKWGRELVLGDLVRVIRRFRPDVIISRFDPGASSGHGHHTAMGRIVPEAFRAAADPTRFPEQLREGFESWQAKRLYWSPPLFSLRDEQEQTQRTDRIRVNTGQYDPVLGRSYAELGGLARSMHRSQGMGASQRKGDAPAFFGHVAGDPVERDLFEDIDISWQRVEGAEEIASLVSRARDEHRADKPAAILPLLFRAYALMEKLDDPWIEVKRKEVVRAIELAGGLWVDAAADVWNPTPGAPVELTLSALNRSNYALTWMRAAVGLAAQASVDANSEPLVYNRVSRKRLTLEVPRDAPYSQPAWLQRSGQNAYYGLHDPSLSGLPGSRPALEVTFSLRDEQGVELFITKPVLYRWVDRAFGERTRPLAVVPPVAVGFSRSSLVFPDNGQRTVAVRLVSNTDHVGGRASLDVPKRWRVVPRTIPFKLARRGQELTLRFELQPPSTPSSGFVTALLTVGDESLTQSMKIIEYPHISTQVVFPKAEMRVERTDVRVLSNRIGYVMGSGDRVPEALEQLGASATLLSRDELASGDLSRFDTVILGIRALNTRPDVLAARERLLGYVRDGGTLVVQYNTVPRRRGSPLILAPYPVTPSYDRVSVEDAPVQMLDPNHALFTGPNRITAADFEGWVQERGLYFMGDWDQRYDAPLASNDPGEPPRRGGLLYARYGKGVYIYTGYSWFRQLPAGVPGAFRLFANLVSAK